MKTKFLFACICLSGHCFGQQANSASPINPLSFGVVLEHHKMKDVISKLDITYLKDEKGELKLDLYLPPGLSSTEKRPAIIFLNAIGERPGERKVKSWGIYTSWPRLMAANGYIGISMECDGSRVPESIQGLFDFIDRKGATYQINTDKLGVYAASANVGRSAAYLMGEKAYKGIKAAVLYYGSAPGGPFRKDLPVLFVIAEGDVRNNQYNALWSQVLLNNAPWTIKMGTNMPHAFDAYADNDESRKVVKETISFWQNYLDPVPAPSWPYSKARDIFGSLSLQPARALELLKSLADEYPNDIPTLSFYGSTLRRNNKPTEAESVYKKILGLQPKNIEALIALAALNYSQNKTAEAEQYVTAAMNSGAMTRNSYADLGFTLLVENKNKEAAKFYEKALSMEPRGIDYYNLACAYAKDNVKDKALEALDQSLKYGYGSRQQFESDPDLDSLKTDSRFKSILQKIK